MTTPLEIAKAILEENGSSMHVREIAEVALRNDPSLASDVDTLVARFATALSTHTKTKEPSIVRVKNDNGSYRKGVYRLKRKINRALPLPLPPEEVSRAYCGKAGEYAVMSELLFWGFNASLMAVDDGIDVVASKGSRYFHLQVKTANESETGGFQFTIRSHIFENHNRSDTFYVLVMRRHTEHSRFLVLGSAEIDTLLKRGQLAPGKSITIRVKADAGWRSVKLASGEELRRCLNAFDTIK